MYAHVLWLGKDEFWQFALDLLTRFLGQLDPEIATFLSDTLAQFDCCQLTNLDEWIVVNPEICISDRQELTANSGELASIWARADMHAGFL